MLVANARFNAFDTVDMDITFEEGDKIPPAHKPGDTIQFAWHVRDTSDTALAIGGLYADNGFDIAPYVPPPPAEIPEAQASSGNDGEQIA